MHIFKIARALLIFFSCGYLTFRATTGLQKVNNGGIGVAVSSMTNKGDSKYPLYTFCPQWANSTHPDGLYDGKLTIGKHFKQPFTIFTESENSLNIKSRNSRKWKNIYFILFFFYLIETLEFL